MRENSEVVIVYPDKMILKHEAKRSEKNVFGLTENWLWIQPYSFNPSNWKFQRDLLTEKWILGNSQSLETQLPSPIFCALRIHHLVDRKAKPSQPIRYQGAVFQSIVFDVCSSNHPRLRKQETHVARECHKKNIN